MSDTLPLHSAITELPLPLAQTLRRAANAKSPQEQHNGAYYFFESALKLSAAAQIGVYVSLGCTHAPLNQLLENLARPSVGHWLALLREISGHLAQRPDNALLPLSGLHDRLTDRQALPAVRAFLEFAAKSAGKHEGRQALRVLDFFDVVVAYRNQELGHGAMRERAFYAEAAPLLLAATLEAISSLKPVGNLQFAVTRDVVDPRTQKASRRFDVLRGDGLHVPMEANLPEDAAAESGRLVLGAGNIRVNLHPLLVYEIDTLDRDRIGYLNHVTTAGRGDNQKFKRVEFLDYDSGDRLEGHDAIHELAALLSKVRGQTVSAQAVESLSRGGTELLEKDTPADRSQFIGDFELLEELGRGGMGIVYKARQNSLRRVVALKVLPPALAGDPVSVARFRREIAALGRCDHANVVKVLTAGQDGDRTFYAMEYVEGSDLAQVCAVFSNWKSHSGGHLPDLKEGHIVEAVGHSRQTRSISGSKPTDSNKLPEMPMASPVVPAISTGRGYFERLAEIIGDAAGGVQHLHEHGIIHRDLKPANIMLTADGKRAVIMDLGLAQLQDRSLSLTASSVRVIGTLRYLPPEQLQHQMLEVTPRADIYSLGATLYELAALAPMFDGDTEARLMQQVLQEEPKPPRRVNPAVPRDLETIITVATAKSPAERYASAALLASDLRAFSRGEAISARPPSTFHYLKLFYRKNRPLVHGLAFAAVLMLALATLFVLRLADERAEAERQAGIAKMNERTALSEAIRANKAETAAKDKTRESEERTREVQSALKQSAHNLAQAHLEKAASARQKGLFQSAAAHTGAAWCEDRDSVDNITLMSALDQGRGPIWKTGDVLDGFQGKFVLSQDGRIAIGPSGNDVRIWDVATGSLVRTLEGHADVVLCAALSQDGRIAISGCRDGSLRLWEVNSGHPPRILEGHLGAVTCVALSRDGKLAISGSEDKKLCLWDVNSGEPSSQPLMQPSGVLCADLSADGHFALTGARDGRVRLWDLQAHKLEREFDKHGECVSCVAFNASGSAALSGSRDEGGQSRDGSTPHVKENSVRLWDVATGALRQSFSTGEVANAISCVAFSPDGRFVLAGSEDKALRLWEAGKTFPVLTWNDFTDNVRSVAFSQDGAAIFSGSNGDKLRLWDSTTGKPLREIARHAGWVLSAAFSPDGRYALSGSQDGTLRLWDAITGNPIRAFHGHTGWVRSVAFSPDGRYALSGSYDETLRLWDVESGAQVRQPFVTPDSETTPASDERKHWVVSVAFSPDGRYALSGGVDRCVRLWDIASHKEIRHFSGHGGNVQAVAFSPDGRFALSGSVDKTMLLWDLADKERTTAVRCFKDKFFDGIRCVAFSPDGRHVLSGSMDKTLCLWSIDGAFVRTFAGHDARVDSAAFSSDGKFIISGSEDGLIRLWDTETGGSLRAFEGHSGNVSAVAFSPDGRYALSGSWDGSLCLWEVETSKSLRTLDGHAGWVYGVAFSNDGRLALSGNQQGSVQLWDVSKRSLLKTFLGHTDSVRSVAFNRDGTFALSGGNDRLMMLWDLKNNGSNLPLKVFKGHTGAVAAVAFQPNGDFVLSGCEDKTIGLWSVHSDIVEYTPFDDWVFSVAFSTDGKYMMSASGDKSLRRRQYLTNQIKRVFLGYGAQVQSVAFSADGSQALTGNLDGSLTLWDIDTGVALRVLKGHKRKVMCVAFSQDGALALSGSEDHTVRVWDVHTGKALQSFEGHTDTVSSVAFGPYGRLALSGSHDGTLRLWDVSDIHVPETLSFSASVVRHVTWLNMRDLKPAPVPPPTGVYTWNTPDALPPPFLRISSTTTAQGGSLALEGNEWLDKWDADRRKSLHQSLSLYCASWNDQFEGYRYKETRDADGLLRIVGLPPRAQDDRGAYLGMPEGYIDFARWWSENKKPR